MAWEALLPFHWHETAPDTIASSELRNVNNYNDMLIIKNPVGDYTITITAGEEEEHYSLQVAKLPALGTVPDATVSKAASTLINTAGTAQETRIELTYMKLQQMAIWIQ